MEVVTLINIPTPPRSKASSASCTNVSAPRLPADVGSTLKLPRSLRWLPSKTSLVVSLDQQNITVRARDERCR